MIYHIREEEKKIVKDKLASLEEVLFDLESLGNRYGYESTFEVNKEGIVKLLKKGRYNYFDGKELLNLKYNFKDEVEDIIKIFCKEENGNYYLITEMLSNRKAEGKSHIILKDNVELMQMNIVLDRLLFKIAEITMKVSYSYETDSEIRVELEAVAKKLNWLGDLSEDEIKSAELNLSNLELLLNLNKNTKDLSYQIKEDIIGVGFKKYRSEKVICDFTFDIYKDSLSIVKKEDGKFYYELELTKVDSYKDKSEVLKVTESHELTMYGYERLIRDLLPVYIETVKSRLV